MKLWLARITSAMLSVAIVLIGFEIGLHVGGYTRSVVNTLNGFNVRDPVLGHRGRPNVVQQFRLSDFDVVVEHDRDGFRKPGRPRVSPADAPKLLVFGDSFTWGWGVGQGSVFTDLLADDLPQFAVRNLGISGVGTVVEFRLFETAGPAKNLRRGDVVAVMFFRNDFEDNVAGRLNAAVRGRRVVLDDVDVGWDERLDRLRGRSLVFNLVSYNLESWFKTYRAARLATLGAEAPAARVTGHYLAQFRSACDSTGARFLVVEIPDRSLYGEGVIDRRVLGHATAAHRVLLELTQALGVETLDLLPVFRLAVRDVPDQSLTFPHDSHWNAAGHRVAARAIAARIRSGRSVLEASAP